MASASPNTQDFTGFFEEITNFLAVKDEITCSGMSEFIYTVADLDACYLEDEDPLFVIVSGGEVSMYSSDPGMNRPLPLDVIPCE
jgi:hypothetical protein